MTLKRIYTPPIGAPQFFFSFFFKNFFFDSRTVFSFIVYSSLKIQIAPTFEGKLFSVNHAQGQKTQTRISKETSLQ